jgi:hypothetical protein
VNQKAQEIFHGLTTLNRHCKDPNMVKYISFKIGRELFQRYTFEFEINSAQKQEDYDRIVINFYLKIMDRT